MRARRQRGRSLAIALAVALSVATTGLVVPPAGAHDITAPTGTTPQQATTLGATSPASRLVSGALADPSPGNPERLAFETTVTRNPDTAAVLEPYFTTPADPCSPPLCVDVAVDVAPGENRTMYARIEWPNPLHYAHLWGIAPDGSIVGNSSVVGSYDKTAGNERTIPVAQFTVANPQAGTWRLQVRGVFGHAIPIEGSVALVDGPPVEYPRLDVMALADRHLTQPVTVNVVFAGRAWTKEEVAIFRDHLPTEYRPAVHGKERPDCPGWDDNGIVAVRSWSVCHYSGTANDGAAGAKPFF
ncbi:MAG TPA: hypothetical protein VF230_08470, partial [Acidimicrobiales bacterium]